MQVKPVVFFLCGKMGAGKSTTALRLAKDTGAVRISEDEWLTQLYPEEIRSFDDYLRCSARLKPLVKSMVQSLLPKGVAVVLDFPANTRRQRTWLKSVCEEVGFGHRLIYLEADDEVCLARLRRRREEQPHRADFDNEAVFRSVTSHFEPPASDEGLTLEVQRQAS
ncbi:ATP-binding protein [Hydrogenophaga sp. 5NK40-0174]